MTMRAQLIPHLDRLALIEVAFPKFRDGRGYSFGAHLARGGLYRRIARAGRCSC
jgi:uncharacterized protein (DUF934 family)